MRLAASLLQRGAVPLPRAALRRTLVPALGAVASPFHSTSAVDTKSKYVLSFSGQGIASPLPAPEAPQNTKSKRRAHGRPALTAQQAIDFVLDSARAKFDESVDIALGLGIDPRKPNQNLRARVMMPHGTGQNIKIAVFATGEKADEAIAAGATIVGAEDLAERISKGELDFTRCLATPDMMPIVSRVARILGPRGLMPNPKMGTVTMDVTASVQAAMKGEIEIKVDRYGFVRSSIGKCSFGRDKLLDNLRAMLVTVSNEKPSGAQGRYFEQAVVSSTMGPGVAIQRTLLDPASQVFMRDDSDEDDEKMQAA